MYDAVKEFKLCIRLQLQNGLHAVCFYPWMTDSIAIEALSS